MHIVLFIKYESELPCLRCYRELSPAGHGWHTPLIPALGRQRPPQLMDLCEFEASLVYRANAQPWLNI